MTDDFGMRVGTNYEIDVVTTLYSAVVPKDLTAALVVLEISNASGSPILTKKTTDSPTAITITTNPIATADNTQCNACIQLLPADAQYLVPGSYTYEVAATISSVRQVIYPLEDDLASFTVYDSKTWNVATHQEEISKPPAKATKFDREKWRKDHGH
jgi:hypothetical protein